MNPRQAYAAAAKSALTGRELQAAVLMQCVQDLREACKALPHDAGPLDRALAVNRDAWCMIGADATEPQSALPPDVRQNIAVITMFMMDRTLQLAVRPDPALVEPMITINRNIIAGLRGIPLEADAASKAK